MFAVVFGGVVFAMPTFLPVVLAAGICDTDSDCINGGICMTAARQQAEHSGDITHSNDVLPSYCACAAGYTGEVCQTFCPLQCINGGTCELAVDAHASSALSTDARCNCRPGFKGSLCEIQYDQCPDGKQCQNGATCFRSDATDDEIDVFECRCPITHDGEVCQNAIPFVHCPDGTQCFNGSVCRISDATDDLLDMYDCVCPASHTGRFCEQADETVVYPPKKGLTPGEIAGIVIGVLIGLLVVAILFVLKKTTGKLDRHRKSKAASTVGVQLEPDGSSTMAASQQDMSNAIGGDGDGDDEKEII